jgi:choline-sulfatase
MSQTVKAAGWTRRQFLQATGWMIAGGGLALGAPSVSGNSLAGVPFRPKTAQHTATAGRATSALPQQPNLLFIVTDQERAPQHWDAAFNLAANLPARQKLLNDGLSFNRAFCNSSMCSPSRATLVTGLYPPQHGLIRTLTYH